MDSRTPELHLQPAAVVTHGPPGAANSAAAGALAAAAEELPPPLTLPDAQPENKQPVKRCRAKSPGDDHARTWCLRALNSWSRRAVDGCGPLWISRRRRRGGARSTGYRRHCPASRTPRTAITTPSKWNTTRTPLPYRKVGSPSIDSNLRCQRGFCGRGRGGCGIRPGTGRVERTDIPDRPAGYFQPPPMPAPYYPPQRLPRP